MIYIQAHRGASAVCPENTLSAFQRAIDLGADGIECDIHLTKDGRIVVCHDETIDRTSTGKGKISDLTYDKLLQYDFGIGFSKEYKNEKIPLLSQMLDVVKDMKIINIEIKSFGSNPKKAIDDFYQLLESYKILDRLIVSSFDAPLLRILKNEYSIIKTAYLYSTHLGNVINFVKEHKCSLIHPNIDGLDEKTVKVAKDNNIEVNAWTANSKESIKKCIDLGVGIITNYPDVAKDMILS